MMTKLRENSGNLIEAALENLKETLVVSNKQERKLLSRNRFGRTNDSHGMAENSDPLRKPQKNRL